MAVTLRNEVGKERSSDGDCWNAQYLRKLLKEIW